MSTHTHTPPPKEWTGVYCTGPESDQNPEGEEIPIWFVFIGTDDADPIGDVHRFHDHKGAQTFARTLANHRRIDLQNESSPA